MGNILTTFNSEKHSTPQVTWFVFIIVIGTLIRLAIAQRGYNFDIASYRIVADIMANDGNVYLETQRYNYGPIWFYILSFLALKYFCLLNHIQYNDTLERGIMYAKQPASRK